MAFPNSFVLWSFPVGFFKKFEDWSLHSPELLQGSPCVKSVPKRSGSFSWLTSLRSSRGMYGVVSQCLLPLSSLETIPTGSPVATLGGAILIWPHAPEFCWSEPSHKWPITSPCHTQGFWTGKFQSLSIGGRHGIKPGSCEHLGFPPCGERTRQTFRQLSPWLPYSPRSGCLPDLSMVLLLNPPLHSIDGRIPLSWGWAFVTYKPTVKRRPAPGHAWLWNHFPILMAQEGKCAYVTCTGVVIQGGGRWEERPMDANQFLPLGSLCALSTAPFLTLIVQYRVYPLTILL